MTYQDTDNARGYIFFGTDAFSVGVLDELEKVSLLPSLVVCAPDRPKGRGLILTPPPAKLWAQERNIPVLQPEKLDDEFVFELKALSPKLFVVASYGKIMPKALVDMPEKGTLNVHPSLLPRWRGASPIESQILNDEKECGLTLMLMDEKMDHGPILDQEVVEVPYWPMKGSELRKLLAQRGGILLGELIPEWLEGNIIPQEQDHTLATFSKKITKNNGLISLDDDPYKNLLKIRAYDIWPRAYYIDENKKRVIVTDAEVQNGALILKRVIPEGKKEQEYKG